MLNDTALNFFILGAAAILLIGFIGRAIAKKTSIPYIIWLMIFGILVVPVFSLVQTSVLLSALPFISVLVILILLFNAGLVLNIKKLTELVSKAMISALINFTLSAAFVFLLMYFLGYSTLISVITAFAVGSVSAEVIPFLGKGDLSKDKKRNLLNLESAITEPLCIVLVLVIIGAVLLNNYQISAIATALVSQFSIGIVLGAILAIAWIPAMSYLQRKNYAYSYVASLAIVFILYILVQDLGGSGPVSALIFGLVIANGEDFYKTLGYKHGSTFTINEESKSFNDLITFFTTSFFFVYFGGLVLLNDYYGFLLGISIALVLLLARQVGTKLALLKSDFSKDDKRVVSSMVSRGTAAAVVATLPIAYGILNVGFIDIIFAVIISTVTITWIMLFIQRGNIDIQTPPKLVKQRKKIDDIEKWV